MDEILRSSKFRQNYHTNRKFARECVSLFHRRLYSSNLTQNEEEETAEFI